MVHVRAVPVDPGAPWTAPELFHVPPNALRQKRKNFPLGNSLHGSVAGNAAAERMDVIGQVEPAEHFDQLFPRIGRTHGVSTDDTGIEEEGTVPREDRAPFFDGLLEELRV